MNKKELLEKIMKKKEFSQLCKEDVELALSKFDVEEYVDEEKVKLTRELLMKVFTAFIGRKILNLKGKSSDWILKKHKSTRERFEDYGKIYSRLLKGYSKKINILDLGAGVNGFSYNYFKEIGFNVNYLAIESVGQFVGAMNFYFQKEKLDGRALHLSLFDLEKIKNEIKKTKKPKIVFLFKTIDSLEMLERNYSKKFLLEVIPLVDKIIISFATRSLVKKEKFKANRKWLMEFITKNFKILDDFEINAERYICFKKV